MREEYDFSKGMKNPYAKALKQSTTIRLDEKGLNYFKAMSQELNIPYQTLINLFLNDCADRKLRPNLKWS